MTLTEFVNAIETNTGYLEGLREKLQSGNGPVRQGAVLYLDGAIEELRKALIVGIGGNYE